MDFKKGGILVTVDPITLKLITATAQKALKSKVAVYCIIGFVLINAILIFSIMGFFISFLSYFQTPLPAASNNLIGFLEKYEGYSATPYRGVDSQNLTIGFGHVIQPGESYTYLTKTEAEQLFANDLSRYIESVQKEFKGTNLDQNQFDALVSLCYNLGPNIWSKISLDDDIKNGASLDVIEADFEKLDHVGNKEIPGLLKRRKAEFQVFAYGIYQ